MSGIVVGRLVAAGGHGAVDYVRWRDEVRVSGAVGVSRRVAAVALAEAERALLISCEQFDVLPGELQEWVAELIERGEGSLELRVDLGLADLAAVLVPGWRDAAAVLEAEDNWVGGSFEGRRVRVACVYDRSAGPALGQALAEELGLCEGEREEVADWDLVAEFLRHVQAEAGGGAVAFVDDNSVYVVEGVDGDE